MMSGVQLSYSYAHSVPITQGPRVESGWRRGLTAREHQGQHVPLIVTYWSHTRLLGMIWFEERALLFYRNKIWKSLFYCILLYYFIKWNRKQTSGTADCSVKSVSLTNEAHWWQKWNSIKKHVESRNLRPGLNITEFKLRDWCAIMKEKDCL